MHGQNLKYSEVKTTAKRDVKRADFGQTDEI